MIIKLLVAAAVLVSTSIYSLHYASVDGEQISMSDFQGKKILLVNIATNSPNVSQLQGLQTLHEQYGDSLVIIAFPSNSFGNESRTNAEIKLFCQSTYQTSFRIAGKSAVTGTGKIPLYQWLASAAQNGDVDLTIGGDFQKVLIGSDGIIRGIYSPKLEPTHPQIIQGITTSY